LSENDIFASEGQWKKRYVALFQGLQGIKSQKVNINWMSGEKVSYTSRCYYLDETQRDFTRYQCTKSAATALLPDFSSSNRQLQFAIIK